MFSSVLLFANLGFGMLTLLIVLNLHCWFWYSVLTYAVVLIFAGFGVDCGCLGFCCFGVV